MTNYYEMSTSLYNPTQHKTPCVLFSHEILYMKSMISITKLHTYNTLPLTSM